jgi:hypothetical protein
MEPAAHPACPEATLGTCVIKVRLVTGDRAFAALDKEIEIAWLKST